jgi:hypothetical protein
LSTTQNPIRVIRVPKYQNKFVIPALFHHSYNHKPAAMKKISFLFLLFFMGYCCPVFSQTKSLQLGVKLMSELTLWDGIAPGAGIQLVYKLAKHGGFETGLNWQNRRMGTVFTEGPPPSGLPFYEVNIRLHRLHIPLLYRFNSKALNVTLGPVIDFRLASSVKTNDPDPAWKRYKGYRTQLLATAGVSHSFYLSSKWILEPEIAFNYVNKKIGDDDGGMNINLSFRKRL